MKMLLRAAKLFVAFFLLGVSLLVGYVFVSKRGEVPDVSLLIILACFGVGAAILWMEIFPRPK